MQIECRIKIINKVNEISIKIINKKENDEYG